MKYLTNCCQKTSGLALEEIDKLFGKEIYSTFENKNPKGDIRTTIIENKTQ